MKPRIVLLFLICSGSISGQVVQRKEYAKADSIAALYHGHSLENLPALAFKLTTPLLGEKEKFRAIYTWVCTNIENDYTLYYRNRKMREKLTDPDERKAWNNKLSRVVFKTLREDKRTICTGYAYLIQELAYHAGIESVIVDGYGRTIEANIGGKGIVNHSWNAVRLNNTWYLCDATWSSGAIDPKQRIFLKRFDDSYFLADPAIFIRSHYPVDTTWMLLKEKPTLHEFLNAPIIYVAAFRHGINVPPAEKLKIDVMKGETISFSFIKIHDSPICKIEMVDGSSRPVKPEVHKAGKVHSAQHRFNRRGKRAVHILFDGQPGFSYEVHVK